MNVFVPIIAPYGLPGYGSFLLFALALSYVSGNANVVCVRAPDPAGHICANQCEAYTTSVRNEGQDYPSIWLDRYVYRIYEFGPFKDWFSWVDAEVENNPEGLSGPGLSPTIGGLIERDMSFREAQPAYNLETPILHNMVHGTRIVLKKGRLACTPHITKRRLDIEQSFV